MQTPDEPLQRRLRAEAASLAEGLRTGEIDYLLGVRRLAALRFEIFSCDRDEDFLLFAAIDSETDHLPHHGMRDRCSVAWLERCDREVRDVEAFYRQPVSSACGRISTRFADAG